MNEIKVEENNTEQAKQEEQNMQIKSDMQEELGVQTKSNIQTNSDRLFCQIDIKKENYVLENKPFCFIGICILYAVFFTISFFKNFEGITYPLITVVTIGICGLFLKKSNIPWKSSSWYCIIGAVLLGISTVLTTNGFVLFFNTIGIILLITVYMIRKIYNDKYWNLGQYICNILFLYLSMIPELASPFINIGKYIRKNRTENKKNKNVKYIVYGILLGIPMVCFAVALLSSADVIFSNYIGNIFRNFWGNIVFSPNLFLIIVLLMLGFFGSYTFLSALTLHNMPEWSPKKEKKNPITAITFTGMITVIYLIFCAIQIVFLFTGGRMLPEGYTYAEYAHQGFFQLLFICIFNLILVVFCISAFQKSPWLTAVLLVFSACTYVMIASSAFRMILYIATYHLTFLRVLVLWFLAMLVILMAGVIYHIIKPQFPLFRYSMIVVTICYLLFSFGKIDYWIAKYNVAQMGDTISYKDMSYLCSLSSDAAPAIKELNLRHSNHEEFKDYPEESYIPGCTACKAEQYFQWTIDNNKNKDIRNFNFSQYQAVKAAEAYNNRLTRK